MTAGAGLTSTAFSCGFGCMVEPLLSVLAFSVGASVFGFPSGFFSSDTGADLTSVGFSEGFCGTPGFFPSASIFSVGAAVFGVSSGFFYSGAGAGFTSEAFSEGFCGVTVAFSVVLSGVFAGASRFLPISLSDSNFPGGVPFALPRKRKSRASFSVIS